MTAQTHADGDSTAPVRLRDLFAGRRGRLLIALLVAEFGAAVQSIAYSSVLPIAAGSLHGTSLFGATLGAGSFTTILVLAIGPAPFAKLSPRQLLLGATLLYVVGALMCVTATAMILITLGVVVRGLAAGMLAGFGLSALGGLFEGEARVRVYGLFALVWLLPSLAGPVVNAAVAVAGGWRAAFAWPAVLVLLGRVLIGRDIDVVPWSRSRAARPSPLRIAALLVGLLLAGVAGVVGGWAGWACSSSDARQQRRPPSCCSLGRSARTGPGCGAPFSSSCSVSRSSAGAGSSRSPRLRVWATEWSPGRWRWAPASSDGLSPGCVRTC